jgi:hypothetical protein
MPLAFDTEGLLPAGDHAMTIDELRASVLVAGPPGDGSAWDHPWRMHLVNQLAVLCGHLRDVGITEIYADGSFASDKARPGDIDGYFVCDLMQYLNQQFPHLIARDACWDLGQRRPDAHGKMKPLMWHRYQVELFPQYTPPFESLAKAAIDPHGRPVLFPEYFRRTRDGSPRGIIRIV